MKFKVGDRVRVARWHSSFNSFGKMDCWIGKVMTISDIWLRSAYRMKEDKGEFVWNEDCLEPVNDTIIINHNGNTVTAINKSTNKKGIAKCNPSDTFDLYTGSKLALDRLFKMEKTKVEKSPVREVKRPAKVGEWVKVVKARDVPLNDDGTPSYKNGDVLYVISIKGGFPVYRDGKDKIGRVYVLLHYEYVVLENYTPSEPEPVKETFYNGKVVCVDKNENHGLYTTGKIYEFVDGQMTCDNRSKFPSFKIHSFAEWQVFSSAKWLEIKEEQEKAETNKFYNGKVVCVDAGCLVDIYTTGKIYKFVNGIAVDDNGFPFWNSPTRSFEEWQALDSAKWLEIKE